jgi:hypothetical protein
MVVEMENQPFKGGKGIYQGEGILRVYMYPSPHSI